MSNQFETIIQAAIPLAVNMPVFFIGNGSYTLRVFIEFPTQIDLQFNAQVAGGIPIENGVGLVIVGLNGNTASLVKAFPTVSLIVVPIVVGLVIGGQMPASIAGGEVIRVAMETKHPIPVPLAVFPPYAVPAVIAQNGPAAVAVIAKKPPVELPPLILLQHASTFGADQLVMTFKIFAHVLPPIIIDLVYYRRNIT
jgi:hypothetical protein